MKAKYNHILQTKIETERSINYFGKWSLTFWISVHHIYGEILLQLVKFPLFFSWLCVQKP